MAERRLRFRKNETPAKEVGAQAARVVMASAVHREDPPPAQNVPVGRANEEIEEWYIPVSQEDFVDIWRRGGHIPVASGLTRREAETILTAHNAAVARIKGRSPPTPVANPVPMPAPARAQPTRTTIPRAQLHEATVDVENIHLDHNTFSGRATQIQMGPAQITIRVRGEGDPRGLLEEAARLIDEDGSPVTFRVRSSSM